MGLLDSLRNLIGRKTEDVASVTTVEHRNAESGQPHAMSVSLHLPDCVQLSGTTTIAANAAHSLAVRHGIENGGYLELTGQLQRETDNPRNDRAIAVIAEGERIGYLPGIYTDYVRLGNGIGMPVPVQIFTAIVPRGFRCEAWVWLGDGEPEWQWSEADRPPLSPQEKARANHEGNQRMVREALSEGGERAKQFQQGMVNGVHYLETIEPIKQLKREGKLEEALALCMQAVQAAENEALAEQAEGHGREPAPWYTQQAAIILRKLKRPEDEEAVLRRYLEHVPEDFMDNTGPQDIKERLRKMTEHRPKR